MESNQLQQLLEDYAAVRIALKQGDEALLPVLSGPVGVEFTALAAAPEIKAGWSLLSSKDSGGLLAAEWISEETANSPSSRSVTTMARHLHQESHQYKQMKETNGTTHLVTDIKFLGTQDNLIYRRYWSVENGAVKLTACRLNALESKGAKAHG
jgi:hypothetical protein